jgi:hypothetical protein
MLGMESARAVALALSDQYSDDPVLAGIVAEIADRIDSGESVDPESYAQQHPEHAERLRSLWPMLLAAADLGPYASTSEFSPDHASAKSGREGSDQLGDFRLIRKIGSGGMGSVFEAVHVGRGYRRALKTLPKVSGDSLHRFKREFRVLADVTHPNLVGLHTLENDGGQWFITMDLLDGCDFLSYVRPSGRMDEVRLRAGLGQLISGLMALHGRGVVHRDLKPSNVIVTKPGRVVILDFGLVVEWGHAGIDAEEGAAGTPAYMAPEHAAGGQIGPPADWYAVGVMLFEALAGYQPFTGNSRQIISDKQRRDAPPLPDDPSIPADLADLCARLLARDPIARPDPLHIARAFAACTEEVIGPTASADRLIGRESQLAELSAALAEFRRARSPVIRFVKGRSGEGKTSLTEHFLAPLRKEGSLVVMSGRCYDRESVPFKALDTLVDALTSHLRCLSDAEAALLLPDDIDLLAEVFPVLRRCEVITKAPRRRLDALDQQQVRQRSFAALRLLLARLGERTPLIWFIDDLQWGDADSAGALFEVLRPPAAPHVLFLGSFRSDEAEASPFLTEWANQQKRHGIDLGERAVWVGPLTLEDTTRLVVNVLERDDEFVRRRAIEFHSQTGGNAFLLTELVGCFDPDADAFRATDIQGVLGQKLEQLPDEAESLLKFVSISGQPLDLDEAAEAVAF